MRSSLSLLLAALSVLSCTFSPKPISVTVKWDLPRSIHRAEPSKSEDMNCYFINVSGPGMPQNYGPGDLANSDPACLGVTSVFGPYDLETLKVGTQIKVIPGNPRSISVLGAVSGALANECGQHPLPEYFNTASPPQLYTLGSTTTRVFIDSAITIQDSYSVSTAEDLVRKCSAGGTTGTSLGNGIIASVKAFAVESGINMRHYTFDDSTMSFTSNGTVPLTSPPVSFRPLLSDDFTRFFLVEAGVTPRADIFSLDPARFPTFISTLNSINTEGWSDAKLSPNGDNLYVLTPTSIYTYRHRNNVTAYQTTYATPTPTGLAVTPEHVYLVGGTLGRLILSLKGYKRVRDVVDSVTPISDYDPIGLTAANGASILIDRNYRYLYLVAPPLVRSFKIGADGIPEEFGNQVGIGEGPTHATLTRDGKYIILVENIATPVIRLIPLADGNLTAATVGTGLVNSGGGAIQIVLEPRQKYLFVKTNNGNVIPVGLNFSEANPFSQLAPLNLFVNGFDAPISTHLDFVPVFEQN